MQPESISLEKICNITFDEWLEFCEQNRKTDKFFTKMKAGIVEDGCQNEMRARIIDGEIAGVIATKHMKKYANLKWIVTSPEFRGQGVFRDLCEDSVKRAFLSRLDHYRVSINPPALEAYQKVGFKIWGVQQSDCLLSIGQLRGPSIADLGWDWDKYVEKEVTKQGRGGCVKDHWTVAK